MQPAKPVSRRLPTGADAMNLFALLNRGAAHAPSDEDRALAAIKKAAEATREKWLDAIMVDQTRAWMGIGESDQGIIDGMTTMLAIAGFAHVYDAHSVDTPDLRVIRGAISTATQCARNGSRVTVEDARAFSSAADRALAIIKGASVEAIIHAAETIRETVGL